MGVKQVKAVINGVTTVLTLNSSTGKYEATITAPAKSSYKQTGHYYPVSVTAEDLAGNTTTVNDKHSTLGSNLRLTVKKRLRRSLRLHHLHPVSLLQTTSPQLRLT